MIDILLIAALAVAGPIPAFATETHQFDVPAEDAPSAIRDFASQAHVQILVAGENVSEKRLHPVAGEFSTEEGLRLLLADSGLSPQYVGDRSIALVKASDASSPSQGTAKEGKKSSSQDFRVAQVDQGANSQSSAVGSNVSGTQDNENKGGLEEIIVTAQKREERLIDVPISIVAITGDELDKRKINGIDDLQMDVPGLAIESNGGTRYISIRGVSDAEGGNLPQIGMYLDEADVTGGSSFTLLDVATYDLERVEVLRGPQGTLFGEGSAGGTIRFITKNPVLDKFTFDANSTAMFTEDGAPSQRIESVVNVPLVGDVLALRIAGTFDHEGGWINQPAANVTDFNDQNRTDVRIKGLWQPDQQFAANAMVVIHRHELGPNIGEDGNGNYTQQFGLTTTPHVKDDYDVYNLTLTYDWASVRVLNTATYMGSDNVSTNFGFVYPPYAAYQSPVVVKTDAATQELRFLSTDSGPWQWTAGEYYRRDRNILSNTFFDALPGPLPAPGQATEDGLIRSWSVFGNTSYKLFDRLTFGAGVRYFEDDQDFMSGSLGEPLGPTINTKDHSTDPRFYIQYKAVEDVDLYASVAKGFRSGGANALNQPSYGPEDVLTYELGAKSSLLDGRLHTDTAVFYSNYKNYQVFGLVDSLDITSNAGDAWIKGIEWDSTWSPIDRWMLSINGDYMDTRFTKITAEDAPYAVGDNLDFVPKYLVTASVQNDFSWNGKQGFARLDYSQQGRETYRQLNLGPSFFSESDIIRMLNFNTSLQWNDQLSLGLFVQNLLDDRGYTDAFSIQKLAPRARPRTFGVQFGVKFD